MANSEIILSAQSHPGDSSTETVIGEQFKGDGYYSRSDGFHTVQYNIAGDDNNAFSGTIEIQATLATNPTDADWFTIDGTVKTYSQEYGSTLKNFTGNYVWVRAKAVFTDGSINSITLNH